MTGRPREPAPCPCPCCAAARCARSTRSDAGRLLLVASDRVSAFDVVMREPIPRKGAVLTQLTAFWFEQLGDGRAHRTSSPPDATRSSRGCPALAPHRDQLAGRAMLVRRTDAGAVRVRGARATSSGSAWEEYRKHGHAGRRAAAAPGCSRATRLEPPLFSPGHQGGDRATTRTSPSPPWQQALGARRGQPRSATLSFARLRRRARPRRRARDHHRRHQVRVRHRRRRARCGSSTKC